MSESHDPVGHGRIVPGAFLPMQQLPPMPSKPLSPDVFSPQANALAALRYMRRRYSRLAWEVWDCGADYVELSWKPDTWPGWDCDGMGV